MFNEVFVFNVKKTLVQFAFSPLLSICTVDELSDDVRLITPSVKPSFKPTVASDTLTSTPGITVILMFVTEQFCISDLQKHT